MASRLSVPICVPPIENPMMTLSPSIFTSDLADVDACDAHLVAVVEPAGVGELRVIGGLREDHRHAGEALADADDQRQ